MAISFPEYNYKQQLQTKQHQINLLRNHWLQPRKDSWEIPSQDADLKHLHGGGLIAKLCPTLATPWTVAHQAALSVGFPRQEYWSRLPFPSPGDLPDPCMRLLHWQKDSLPLCHLSGMQIRSVYSKLLVYVTVDRSVVSGRDTQVWFPVLTIWVLWANKLFFLSIRFLTCETGVVMVSNHIIMLRNNK